MANLCYGVGSEGVTSPCESTSSRAARRRRMHIRRCKFFPNATTAGDKKEQKRQKLEHSPEPLSEQSNDAFASGFSDREQSYIEDEDGGKSVTEISISEQSPARWTAIGSQLLFGAEVHPKFGVASVCGRRRDMEDAVAVHPSFCHGERQTTVLHYFGVYDGHGCSHVAMRCRDRLHKLVKEELERGEGSMDWKRAMEGSFFRMDREVDAWNKEEVDTDCGCEIPDSVGSTAVVAVVTPDKIIVANCGDSRAVLCRKGKPVPLSTDHKPDRPDEMSRIQAAGGRVLFWEGARVLGVLAMSRAIGDNYLKPYVSCEPEVTITDRTVDDDFMILASDGLWDVVSNDTACGVARSCLKGKAPATPETTSPPYWLETDVSFKNSDQACSIASMLLTKLALARRSADNVSVVVIDLKRK